MRLWWEVARRSFVRYSTYRAATIAGVVTNTVFAFIKASVLIAVFRRNPEIGGFDARDVVTFTFVSQGFLAVMGAFTGHLPLAERIQTGDVVTDLYRPVDLLLFELATDAGRAAFQLTVRAVIPLVIGGIVFDLRLPTTAPLWLAFALALALGFVVSFGLRFLVTMTTFWFLDFRAPSQMMVVVGMFLSGIAVPVVLFPDWLETLARGLPFVAYMQVPIEVLLGKHSGVPALLRVFALQAAWIVALLALGRVVLARATRRVVVQGG